jgi:hypothetical protein
MTPDETEALRAIIRKVEGSPRMWAALSFVDGVRGSHSAWTPEEQETLRRAGL